MRKRAMVSGIVVVAFAIFVFIYLRQSEPARSPQPTGDETAPAQSAPHAPDRDVPSPRQQPAPQAVEQGEKARQTVSGAVRFINTEEPAAGVVVEAWSAKTQAKEFEAATDEEGKYMMAGFTPGIQYGLTVENEEAGYVASETLIVQLHDGESRTGVDMTICATCSISGTVTDKSVSYHPRRLATVRLDPHNQGAGREAVDRALVDTADKPLPGVRITLVRAGFHVASLRRPETISDGRGQYAFRFLPPGNYEVSAEPPEGAVSLRDRHPDQGRALRLQPGEHRDDVDFSFRFDGLSIAGCVTDTGGIPIAGAELTAEYGPRWIGESNTPGRVSVNTVSDEDGRYRLDGLLPTDIRQASYFLKGGSLPRREERMISVRASALGYVPAQILVPPITEDLARDAKSFTEEVARRGLAEELPAPQEVALPVSRGNVISLDFALQGGATVTGRLLDTQGTILPNSRIRMVLADPPDRGPLVIQELAPDWTETDGAGQFVLENVPPGAYLFQAENRMFGTQKARNAPLEVSADELVTDLDVIVEAPGDISGLVVDAASGDPIEKFSVMLTTEEGTTEHRFQEGTFLIKHIPAGIATLKISATGYGPEEVQVEVASGQTDMTFSLAPEGLLHGCVTLNGEGTVAKVKASHAEGGPSASTSVATDEEGYYEIKGLREGLYQVKASIWSSSKGTRYESAWAEVGSGRVTRVDFELGGNATIRGTFSYPDKDLRWHVVARNGSATGPLPPFNSPSFTEQEVAMAWDVEESGYYEIGNLPSGTYNVTGRCCIYDRDARDFIAVAEQSELVSVSEGDVAEVNFDFQ